MKKIQTALLAFFLLLILFFGLYLFALSVSQYETSYKILGLLSRDGKIDSYTLERYSAIRVPMMAVGILFGVAGGLGLAFFPGVLRLCQFFGSKFQQFWRQFRADAGGLWKSMIKPGFARWEWWIVLFFIALAFVGRWIWVERPMFHDESYTFVGFAQRPFIKVISDYHLPNNHILNSILIHFLYKIFGNVSPLIVRFPAFLAGILCVPLGYAWARKKYGIPVAVISAALIATFPWLKMQSTNGRGYMLMAMFTLAMLLLAERVRVKKDLSAWVALVVVTALSFYTLPISMYPFGIIGLWLFVSALRGEIAELYLGFWKFLKYLASYAFFTVLLTLLLYSPIFVVGTGWDSVFNNIFVKSLEWNDFIQTLPVRLSETYQSWAMDLPEWYYAFLCIGVLLSLAYHAFSRRDKAPLQFCAIAAMALMFVVQRPNPWTRILTFILPILLVWAASGWYLLIGAIFRREPARKFVVYAWVGITLAVTIGLSFFHIANNLKYYQGEKGQEETITLILKDQLTPQDIVLTSNSFDPAYFYYFELHGLPMQTIDHPDFSSDWRRIYFVVNTYVDDDFDKLFAADRIIAEECSLEPLQEMLTYGSYTVYLCVRGQ